jgi:hypothetical protein
MADKLRRALEESHARIATLETENAALKLNHRNEMAAMEKRLRQSGAVVPWAGLPDELVEKVLAKVLELLQAAGQAGGVGFFPSSATVRLVCSGWKAVHDAVVTRLVLRRETTDEVMGMLVLRFPAVVSLEYKWITGGTALTDAGLRVVTSLPALTSLDLTWCSKLTGEGLRVVSSLPALTSLNLRGCFNYCRSEVADEGVRAVSNIPALTSLNLSFSREMSDEALRSLSNLPALKSLDLSWCEKVTDVGVRTLSNLPALKSLDLRGCFCRNVTAAGVQALRSTTVAPSLHIVR